MNEKIEATFDGKVFRPLQPIVLAPNTQVQLTFEPVRPAAEKTASFLETARNLKLQGPANWSTSLDGYLCGLGDEAKSS